MILTNLKLENFKKYSSFEIGFASGRLSRLGNRSEERRVGKECRIGCRKVL